MNLEFVYNELNTHLRKFIRGRVSDQELAEDILQDVYMKIHQNIDSVRNTNRLTPWIYQITRNAITDYYRRTRPIFELTEDLEATQIEETDLYAELASSVRGMLDCLPPEYGQALLLSDLQGMNQEEVARQLGLSLSGAKSRIQRARQKLKQAFLDCCHFEFDHNGKLMDFQSNCGRCANDRSEDECVDRSCENVHPSVRQAEASCL